MPPSLSAARWGMTHFEFHIVTFLETFFYECSQVVRSGNAPVFGKEDFKAP